MLQVDGVQPPPLDARWPTAEADSSMGSNTPKTPTEGAWLALMEDDDDVGVMEQTAHQEHRSGTVGPSPRKNSAATQGDSSNASNRVVAFWESLMNADNASGRDGHIASMSNSGQEHTTTQRESRTTESRNTHQSQHSTKSYSQNRNQSYTAESSLLSMLQCGSIDTTAFLKLEEDFSVGIERFAEKVDSPCKMMDRPNRSGYHHDRPFTSFASVPAGSFNKSVEHIHPLNSQTDDSGILQKGSSDLISELKDEIPVLRERYGGESKASKYKKVLDEAPRVEPPSEVHFLGKLGFPQTVQPPLSPSKRFHENAVQGISYPNEMEPSTLLPNQEFPERTQRAEILVGKRESHASGVLHSTDSPAKTARTESISLEVTQNEDLAEENNPRRQHSTAAAAQSASKGRQNRSPPVESVEAVTPGCDLSDDIMNGISSLTADLDFNQAQLLQANRDLIARQQTLYVNDDPISRTCMPPVLIKKFNALRSISLSKSLSSTMSSNTHKLNVIPRDRFAEYVTDNGDGKFIYEYECGNHAYVAFFRRGTSASQSIRLYEHPTPVIFPTLPHELVVRIEASTVSSTDCQVRRGDFWGERSENALNLPIVPGVAFAGRVHQLSSTSFGNNKLATGLNKGDRVISLVHVGANSRHLCIASDKLVKVPEQITDPCAVACLPEIYLTAFQTLHFGQKNGARYRKTSLAGKTLLILGGATTVGRALIEVAKAAGCQTIYATGKDKQFEAIRTYGGAPLGRDPEQWCSILTGRVDMVVGNDNTVGTSELSEKHMNLLARNGRAMILTAPNSEHRQVIDLDELEDKSLTTGRKLVHYNVFDAWEMDLKQGKRDLTHLMKLLSEGLIRPKILERIPLNRVAKAQDLLEGKKMNGFVICEPWILGRKKNEILRGTDGAEVYAESASKADSNEMNQGAAASKGTTTQPEIVTTNSSVRQQLCDLD